MRFKTGKVLFAAFMLATALSGACAFADDTTAPTIDTLSPANNAVSVPITASISFNIWDTESGVSADTLIVKVNTIDVSGGTVRTGDASSYNISYTPSATFNYGETVTVDISIKDVSENTQTFTYTFTTEMDTAAPSINSLFPTMNAVNVPTNSVISFMLEDQQTGISINTLQVTLNINTVPVSFTLTSSNSSISSYRVTCSTATDFAYGDIVSIDMAVSDVSGNKTVFGYTFSIHQDNTAPQVLAVTPLSGAADVPTDTMISFTLSDTETGVSIDTIAITLNANGAAKLFTTSSSNTDLYGYSVTCDPDTDFYYGDRVTVTIQVNDVSGNIRNEQLGFTIHSDTTAPQIQDRSPAQGATDVPTAAVITFSLNDTETGVSIDTLQVTINAGTFILPVNIAHSGTLSHYQITCDPTNDIAYGATVTVSIVIQDIAGNTKQDSFSFTAHADITAPSILDISPTSGSTDVPVHTPITFTVTDNEESGISINSLQIIIEANGSLIPATFTSHHDSPYLYTVTCAPQAGAFLPYSADITVNIVIRDIAGNSANGTTTFRTLEDMTSPTIQDLYPAPMSTDIPTGTVIAFRVRDTQSGITISALAVTISVNDLPIAYTIYSSGTSVDLVVTCDPLTDLYYAAAVTVDISISDIIGNKATGSYSFTVHEDTTAPQFSDIYPMSGTNEVPTHTVLTFTVSDTETGVNTGSLQVTINANGTFRAYTAAWTGTAHVGTASVLPAADFYYGDTVTVDLFIRDVSGNSSTATTTFFVHQDTNAPTVRERFPAPFSTDIPTSSVISFTLDDSETGIDIGTLQATINVNGTPVAYAMTSSNMDTHSYRITCDPLTDLYYGDTVTVALSVQDVSGNPTSDVFVFFVHKDIIAPVISNTLPTPNISDVPTRTVISFMLSDTETGLNMSSLIVSVNNVNVSAMLVSAGSLYQRTVSYTPAAFYYGDTVTVDISLQDVSGNATTGSYTFFIHTDILAPTIADRYPAPGSTDVPTATIMTFALNDAETGVSINSLRVTVNANGNTKAYVLTSGNTTIHSYGITVDPAADLYYGDIVTLDITATDISGNILTTGYTFFVHMDTTKPSISDISPASGSVDIPTNCVMTFTLSDSETGVSIDSLSVTVHADEETVTCSLSHTNGSLFIYQVTCDPQVDFNYGAHVTTSLSVRDISGNITSTVFTFHINTPPVITPVDPTANDVIVPIRTDIVFDITDNALIVTPSLRVSLNGELAVNNGLSADTGKWTISYTPISNGYRVSIDPTALLPYGSLIPVAIHIEDELGEPTEYTYTFMTDVPPLITPLYPNAGDSDVPVETDITFIVTDNARITTSSLYITINNTLAVTKGLSVNPVSYSVTLLPISDGYRVSIDPLMPFNYETANTISVQVADHEGQGSTISYSFRTRPALEIYVSVTGNNTYGDGTANKPYQTIMKGLTIVTTNGTVYLFPGSYPLATSGNIIWPNKAALHLTGYTAGGASSSNVILDGQSSTRAIYINYLVNATLSELTIKNGQVSGLDGGGIYFGTSGHLDLTNVIVTANSARNGGGIYANGASISANLVIFSGNNAATNGGAGYLGTWSVHNSQFLNNSASNGGIGRLGTWMIDNSIFKGNHADTGGLGYGGSWSMENCTLYNNYADTQGGIMYSTALYATNLICWQNKEAGIEQNQLVACTATLNYSLISTSNYRNGSTVAEDHVLIGDPKFLSSSDLRLMPRSPAINSGTTAVSAANDIRGLPHGIYLGLYDMGAYEYDDIYIHSLQPTNGATNVDFYTGVTFNISDFSGAMDITSVTVELDGIQYTESGAVTFSYTGSGTPPAEFVISIKPTYNFTFDQLIRVTINAIAVNGTSMQVTSSFRTISDTVAPTISPVYPTAGATEIPLENDLVLDLTDDYSGIVTSSLCVSINGAAFIRNGEATAPETCSIVYSEIAGGYRITIDPTIPLPGASTVTINVFVNDLNPNISTMTYTFKTASANVHNTDRVPNRHYTTIHAAFADVQEGQTLTLEPGTYYENLIWPNTQNVSLKSVTTNGQWITIIDGSALAPVISCEASVSWNISGIMLRNGTSAGNGGGMRITEAGSNGTMIDCVVSGSTAANGYGGGIYLATGTTLNMINSIIKNNSSLQSGGLYASGNAVIRIINSVLFKNAASVLNGGGALYGASGCQISNSIFWANTAGGVYNQLQSISGSVDHSIVQNAEYSGKPWNGGNNLSGDPLFSDTEHASFTLQPLSPAIEGGTNNAYVTDCTGRARPQMTRTDIGPYEYASIYLFELAPTTNATNIEISSPISMRLMDIAHSIPTTSLRITVNGITYTTSGTNTYSITGTASPTADLRITLVPTTNWTPNTEIPVSIYAENSSGNVVSINYSFTTSLLYVHNDGYSPARYYQTIQEALQDARAADTILLENKTFLSSVTWDATISKNISLRSVSGQPSSCNISANTFIIMNNTAAVSNIGFTGPLTFTNSTVDITNIIVSGNSAYAVTLQDSTVTIARSVIRDNGTGIAKTNGVLHLDNTLILNNSSMGLMNTSGTVQLRHCTLFGNLIAVSNMGSMVGWNTIIWGNSLAVNGSADITYSDVQDGYAGTGNIALDPMFINTASSDMHVSKNSPTLEHGTPENIPSTDMSGTQPRSSGRYPDMGLFERPEVRLPLDWNYFYTDLAGSTENITATTTIVIKRMYGTERAGSIIIVPIKLGIDIFTFDLSHLIITKNASGLPFFDIPATAPLAVTVNSASPAVTQTLSLSDTAFSAKRPLMTLDLGFGAVTIMKYNGTERTSVPSSDYRNKLFFVTSNGTTVTFSVEQLRKIGTAVISTVSFTSAGTTTDAERSITISVRVFDSLSTAVEGAPVHFTRMSGTATLVTTLSYTNAAGEAIATINLPAGDSFTVLRASADTVLSETDFYVTGNALNYYAYNQNLSRGYLTLVNAFADADLADNHVITLGAGTHYEVVTWPNKQNITLRGTAAAAQVILNGSGSNSVIQVLNAVTLNLQNITIENGSPSGQGGAIAAVLAGITVSMNDCIVSGNQKTALYFGGSGTFTRVTFNNNTSSGGGAVMVLNTGKTRFENCVFRSNQAGSNGGGAFLLMSGAAATFNACRFENNAAESGGAGLCNAAAAFTNCIFASNNATYYGGGLRNDAAGTTIRFGTFYNNSAPTGSAIQANSSITAINSILWNNSGAHGLSGTYTISYSDLQGWSSGGTGIITSDPLFADATLQLIPTSAALDAGTTISSVSTDFAGEARFRGFAPDMGAYEAPTRAPVLNTTTMTLYASIASALASANSGETLTVRPGTYYENLSWPELNGITLKGDTYTTSVNCVIDGSAANRVITVPANTSLTLIGLTVQNGLYSAANGGGIYLGTGASISCNTVIISGNIASGRSGGGIYGLTGSTLFAENALFINNRSTGASGFGGGALVVPQSIVRNSTFSGNSAANNGGAIFTGMQNMLNTRFINNSAVNGGVLYHLTGLTDTATLDRCIMQNNTASNFGGGLWPNKLIMVNSILQANNAFSGGAVYGGTNAIEHCLFVSNNATNGSAIYSSSSTVKNSIVWGNTGSTILSAPGSLSYCIVQGGYSGEGNLSAGPAFVSENNGNYHLQNSSPAIEAGTLNILTLSAQDPDGITRPVYTRPDIGLYEYRSLYVIDHLPTKNETNVVPTTAIRFRIVDETATVAVSAVTVNFQGLTYTAAGTPAFSYTDVSSASSANILITVTESASGLQKAKSYTITINVLNRNGIAYQDIVTFYTTAPQTAYVSPNGSDTTGDGTALLPFATIQKGLDIVAPYGTVIVQKGTYPENLTWPNKAGVTLTGATGNIWSATLIRTTGTLIQLSYGVSASIRNLMIEGGSTGLAINNTGAAVSVDQVCISGNTGIGVYNTGRLDLCNSVLITNNSTALSNSGTLNMIFTTIANTNGTGILNNGIGNIMNSIIWGNTAQVSNNTGFISFTYSIIQGSYPGTGNKSDDPRISRSQSGAISFGSSALDAAATSSIANDINGTPRPQFSAPDCGAFEYIGPVIYSYAPSYNEQDIKVTTSIVLKLREPDRGLVLSTLRITVNGTLYTTTSAGVSISGTIYDSTVTLNLSAALPPNTTINPQISVTDVSGNLMEEYGYYFRTVPPLSVLYVSASASAGGSGTIIDPLNKIQSALAYLATYNVTGGVIIVLPGTYTENLIWPTKNLGLTLRGSPSGNSTNIIIDGSSADRVIYIGTNTGIKLTIENLTLQNGTVASDGAGIYCADNVQLTLNNVIVSNNRATGSGTGGGVYAAGNGITMNILNCTFSGNKASYHGGAICKTYGYCSIYGSLFENNTATGSASAVGGAIAVRNQNGELTARTTRFRNNTAGGAGGAIWNMSRLRLYECELYRNQSLNQYAGAVYHETDLAVIVNSLIIENTTNGTTRSGGGLYKNSGTLYLINSTIAGNTATQYGGGIYNLSGGIIIRNNIFWGNSSTLGTTTNAQLYIYAGSTDIQYNDVQGGYTGATNLNIDPQFISTVNLNYEPEIGNLTIESGTANGLYIPTTDIRGRVRPQLGRFVTEGATAQYDLGAYEKTGEDHYPPVISQYLPTKNTTNVPNTTAISFKISDTISGISLNSLQIIVNQIAVTPVVSSNWSTAYVTYNPVTTFNFGSVVQVTINVSDVSGNALVDTYNFRIQEENIAPVFSDLRPTPGATAVTLRPTFSATVTDAESGVSQSTVAMFIDGIRVTATVSGTTANTAVLFVPTASYGYGTFVRVTLNASDMAGNTAIATYSFTTYVDATGPTVNPVTPTNGAVNIVPTAAVEFTITDGETGISMNTLQIILNGTDRTASFNSSGTTASLTLRLVTPNFGYLETEALTIYVRDIAGNSTTYSYSFMTKDDSDAPQLIPVRPQASSSQASHNTTIVFRLTDTESGISVNSMRCTVNGLDRTASCSMAGTGTTYLVTISALEYGYLQTVQVTASATDIRNNRTTVTWSFTTEADTRSPVIFGQSPAPLSVGASQTGPIVFSIVDNGTGVSLDTVTISVSDQGLPVTGTLTASGTGPTYDITFTHTAEFGLMHDIYVTINAADQVGNSTVNAYFFSTGLDTDPPHIEAISPETGSVNVPALPTLHVRFWDNETRIVVNTIRMTVNGTDITGTLVLSGGPSTYDATYTPTRSFAYNSTVQVWAQAADYGSNTTNYSYSFTIEPDTYPPSAPIVSTPSVPLAPATTNIGIFTVTGSAEASSIVRIYDNDVLLSTSQADSTGTFSVPMTISAAGTSVLSAVCMDSAGNISPTSNSFQILLENKALAYSYYDDTTTTNITANILIPVGAVSFNADVSISAQPLAASTNELNFLIAFDLTMLNADTATPIARTSFPQAVIVTIDIDTVFNIPLGSLGIYYFNTITGRWQNDGITLLGVSRNMVVFSTTHFSTFSIAQVTTTAGGPDRWTIGTYVAPNPVDLTRENIHFIYHKKNSGEAAMHVQVYDLSGQKIWEGKDTIFGANGEMAWNGTDMWGEQLANGVYIAYIVIQGDGERVTKRVKFAVLK